MLIKYMARHPDVYRKCQQLGVTGKDVELDELDKNQVYREFVNTINNIGTVPILQDTLLRHITTKVNDGDIPAESIDSIIEFFGFIYGTPVDDPGFFNKRLPEYLHKQRTEKVLLSYSNNPMMLAAELNRVKFKIDTATASDEVRILHPFKNLIFKTQSQLIGTNLRKLDEKLDGGLLLGEYAMLVGFSGGGKSALGSNIVCASAQVGTNSTYISCEETHDNMAQRFYSKAFQIPYSQLRSGLANIELEAKYNELSEHKKTILGNCLSLHSVKGVSDITPDFLYSKLVQEYEETGFVPTIVMLDQMQFVTPNTDVRKGSSAWEVEKVVSAELDELSHRKIGGRNFVLWVQHQAKGKLKQRFTREDIDGFKGVIHKADLVIGVGRDPSSSNEIDLFSIKVRHTADFGITLRTNFQYMDVSSDIGDTVAPDYQVNTSNPVTTTNNPPPAPVMHELPANPFANAS